MNEYENKIKPNDYFINSLAIKFLIDNGRNQILNEEFYNHCLKEIELDKGNKLLTIELRKEILETSKNFAELEPNDLYMYIKNEIIVRKKEQEMER